MPKAICYGGEMKSAEKPRLRDAERTRLAMIQAARQLFTERGYHEVGIRELAAAAGVTRGALYHHFGDKETLFVEVFKAVHADLVADAAQRHRDPNRPDRWTQFRRDLQIALDSATRPDVQQIGLIDGPAVLGWARWRELRAATGLAAIAKGLEASMKAGFIRAQPVLPLANLISGATKEATLLIAHSSDPATTRAEMGQALDSLLESLELAKAATRA